MTNETGTYFKGIYNDLVSQLLAFPSNDPSPNLQECIRNDYVNFVRAEMLARRHNLSQDVITHIREMAILQYFIDFKNTKGLLKLGNEFNLSQSERIRLINLANKESNYPCFSFSKNTEMSINESWGSNWQNIYSPIAKEFTGEKLSLLSRFIAWLKRLFKKK